jgi:carboxyl-terminal processing protease
MKLKKVNERFFWIGITALLLTLIVVLSFSTRVLATGYEAETQRQLGLFYEVLRFVQDNYVDEEAVAPEILIEGALKGMFEALDDPHSAYLSREDMRDLNDTTTGRFGGVGLIISKVERGAEVVSPIEDTPAYRAGITAGDIIVAIEDESILDLSIDEVVKILRGEPGAPVRVTIQRGKTLTFDVTIVRAMIEVPTVKHSMIGEDIGYLRIIQFTPLTPEKVREAIEFFDRNRYRSLIIDLRSNPGGLLTSVIDVADFFLSRGPIVSTRSRVEAENHVFYASQRETLVPPSLPVVVLINRGSASASEILAGALKDTARARLMGETSYGKGSVQQIKSIGEAGFRLTMSRYYTPSGASIDKVGIVPDTEIKEPELTEKEEASFTRLIEGDYIARFVEENPNPGEAGIAAFIETLGSEEIDLSPRIIRRLVRNEQNRTNNNPPLYDLEFDIVLRQAVDSLRAGD